MAGSSLVECLRLLSKPGAAKALIARVEEECGIKVPAKVKKPIPARVLRNLRAKGRTKLVRTVVVKEAKKPKVVKPPKKKHFKGMRLREEPNDVKWNDGGVTPF